MLRHGLCFSGQRRVKAGARLLRRLQACLPHEGKQRWPPGSSRAGMPNCLVRSGISAPAASFPLIRPRRASGSGAGRRKCTSPWTSYKHGSLGPTCNEHHRPMTDSGAVGHSFGLNSCMATRRINEREHRRSRLAPRASGPRQSWPGDMRRILCDLHVPKDAGVLLRLLNPWLANNQIASQLCRKPLCACAARGGPRLAEGRDWGACPGASARLLLNATRERSRMLLKSPTATPYVCEASTPVCHVAHASRLRPARTRDPPGNVDARRQRKGRVGREPRYARSNLRGPAETCDAVSGACWQCQEAAGLSPSEP